jgi:hypothetical protein
MGILALTLIIGFLMAWYLPMGANGGGARRSVSRYLMRRHRIRQFNGGGAYGVGLIEVGLLWFRRHPQKVRRPQGSDVREAPPQAVRPRAVFRRLG